MSRLKISYQIKLYKYLFREFNSWYMTVSGLTSGCFCFLHRHFLHALRTSLYIHHCFWFWLLSLSHMNLLLWYRWKIAELVLNNNHSFTDSYHLHFCIWTTGKKSWQDYLLDDLLQSGFSVFIQDLEWLPQQKIFTHS